MLFCQIFVNFMKKYSQKEILLYRQISPRTLGNVMKLIAFYKIVFRSTSKVNIIVISFYNTFNYILHQNSQQIIFFLNF